MHYDHPDTLLPELTALGRRHERYGVRLAHYAAAGAALIATLRDVLGDAWTARYAGVWVRACTFAAGSMLRAAAAGDGEELLAA
jgi:hemoglobin-like flavoprotein